ncbi:MAG TPA: DUF4349 domain-containing protein [Longimicrobium sp.]|nr:DUF4349 domain-containing protein [Longimicrobium sp.]
MKRTSILPLLLLFATLAACGGGDSAEMAVSTDSSVPESAADPSYSVIVPPPAMEPGAVSSTDAASSTRDAAARGPQAETVAQITSADTVAFAPEQPGMMPGTSAVSLNPMLVRTGQAVVQVDSLDQGIARVRALATRVGAVVGNTTISAGTEETRRAQMELRIPSINFDRAVAGLDPIGKVQSVNVTAEDVGEEYTDVSSRVANARRLEARLLDLLETRSGRLEEVLNLEREVARVREEIERAEGRMRYLRTRSSVSLLTIALHEPQAGIGGPPSDRPIRDAFVTAWHSFVRLVAGLISSLGVLIPLAIFALAGWRFFRWVSRRENARDAAYREALRRERERHPAPAPAVEVEAEEPALRP